MKHRLGLFICMTLAAGLAQAQQAHQPAPSQGVASEISAAKTYTAGDDVTEPGLLSSIKVNLPAKKCKGNYSGSVKFSLVIDDQGRPRNIFLLGALGNELDELALQIAESDRFTPGTKDGSSVAVAATLELQIDACVEYAKDSNGKKLEILHVKSQPTQTLRRRVESDDAQLSPVSALASSDSEATPREVAKVGGEVKAPSILRSSEALYSDEARKEKIQGVCVISLIVDAHGMPLEVKVKKGIGYGLDEQAIAAVRKFRFKPATRNGSPLAAYVNIEVNFRLY